MGVEVLGRGQGAGTVEERSGWQPAGAGEPLLIELEELFRPM